MPTKKRRVGFIPRNGVLDIINELSFENNLSYSKIINILVEEALSNRGLLSKIKGGTIEKGQRFDQNIKISTMKNNVSKEQNYSLKNKLIRDKNLNFKEVLDETIDAEIYDKFLMFLKFKEKMEQRDM